MDMSLRAPGERQVTGSGAGAPICHENILYDAAMPARDSQR
jgi:hypothetical protein